MTSSSYDSKAIVFIADLHYVDFSRVSIKDAWEKSAGAHPIYLFYDGDIGAQNAKNLGRLASKYAIDLRVVRIDESVRFYDDLSGSAHITHTAYAKLLMHEILPDSVKFAYYIDVDTLIVDSLDGFLSIEPTGGIAVADHREDMNYFRLFKRSGTYFNAGVIVANLDVWRLKVSGVAIEKAIKDYGHRFKWLDQDLLMILFDQEWEDLPIEYNFMMHGGYNKYICDCGDKDWDSSAVSPVILHFLGPDKPWTSRLGKHSHRVWRDRYKSL